MDLAKHNTVPVVGLNYKDKRDEALAWLKQFGDPYVLSISDNDGRVGIDYGVYGVPETFVIDKAGAIRLKHIGPVTPQAEMLERLIRSQTQDPGAPALKNQALLDLVVRLWAKVPTPE